MNINKFKQKSIVIISKLNYFIQRFSVVFILIFILLLIAFYANHYKLNLDYKPYNGDFQSFNPVRRILAGEFPGQDFNPYLGLITTYLNTATTYIFGGNFAASRFSTHFLSLTLHLVSLITLFFLCGFTVKKSTIAASIIITILSFDLIKLTPFWELAGPGNSNLSIRAALPFITSLVVLLVFQWREYKIFYCLIGCIIGIQPLWSNDYGIPSFLTLTTIIILDLIKQNRANKFIKIIMLFASAFISFSVAAYILTLGNITNWLKDNFSGVVVDQFWYFVWYNGRNKIFSLTDVFSHPFLYFYVVAISILLINILYKQYTVKYLLLIYIAITVFGAGVLSSVGGTISVHYYHPTILVTLFVIPLTIRIVISNFINTKKTSRNQTHFNNFDKHERSRKYFIVTVISLYIAALATNTIGYRLFLPLPAEKNSFFWVEELGGWLPNKWKPSIQIAKDIKQEFNNELPTPRILSTYTSGMDVVAGAINPTSIDYIIHALGNHARNHYLNQFINSKPKYITTLREDFSKWETWVRRTNWWFYREFVNTYQPVKATFYNIIWQRLENNREIKYSSAICDVIQENEHKATININTEATDDHQVFYVEIALKYHLEVKNSGIPIIGKRGLVNVTEKQTALTQAIAKNSNRSYGMPPSHNNWYIPITHRLGTPSVLEIKAYPENRSQLIVESCQARLFAPVDFFAVERRLTSANLNDVNWKNGILISRPGFIISNQEFLSELYPGMDIEFSNSGKRKITNIKNNQVWVTGSKLDPLADGYPQPIIVTLR